MTTEAGSTTTSIVTNDHFNDLREQIIKLKEINEKTVFDYEDKKQNTAARSYVQKLRNSKTAIANRHKEKKAQILIDGRAIDAGKNELTADIDEMIAVHAEPLKRIKDREDAAIQAAKDLEVYLAEWDEALAEDDLFNRERDIKEREESERLAEEGRRVIIEAERIEKERIEREAELQKEAAEEAKIEAEAKAKAEKELEKFNTDFDEAIAMNKTFDAEKAVIKAELDRAASEEKTKVERLGALKKISDAKDEAGKARVAILGGIGVVLSFQDCREMEESVWNKFYEEKNAEHVKIKREEWLSQEKIKRDNEKKAAEEEAATKQREAVAAEKARQEAEKKAAKDAQDAQEKADKKRAANRKHCAAKNNEAKAGFIAVGLSDKDATEAVKAIASGKIRNVTIQY